MSEQTTTDTTKRERNRQEKPFIPFGSPSFTWPDKTYATKDGKTTTYARVFIPLLGSALTIETVIWKSNKVENGEAVAEFSLSLPRGIVLTDTKDEALKDMLDEYRQSVLTAFDKWESGEGSNGGPAKARKAPVLVRKATPAAK